MKHAPFMVLFLLVSLGIQAQSRLIPDWHQGDTLRYFLSESALVDEERISLKTYEVEFFILKKDNKRFILEGHLHLDATADQGKHWTAFFHQLSRVPFTFYFQPGDAQPFNHPVQAEETQTILKNVLNEFLSKTALQPIPYGEIDTWLKEKNPENGLPQVLLDYFPALNALFDKYGEEIAPMDLQIPFIDEISCRDSLIRLRWRLENRNSFHKRDTLLFERLLVTDSINTLTTYLSLNECGNLKGLEEPVIFDAYHFGQKESWTALIIGTKICSYSFDEEIRIQLGEIQNWQRIQKRIICLKQ